MRKHLTLESRSEMPKNAYDTQVASFQQPESVNTLTLKGLNLMRLSIVKETLHIII